MPSREALHGLLLDKTLMPLTQSFPVLDQPSSGPVEWLPSDNDGFLPPFDLSDLPPFPSSSEKGSKVTDHQGNLWHGTDIHARSVATKLREFGRLDLAEALEHCHTDSLNLVCKGCKSVKTVWNRCDLFYCARCQPRLSRERKERVKWWVNEIRQPKHVVLTMRNAKQFTREYVKHFKESWARLCRMKIAKGWRGGFYSFEVTNEGKGWHLHLHALIDANYIDCRELSMAWARANRDTGYIVKVKDARSSDYLREVTKYAVKGSDLASWSGKDIAEFIDGLTGFRTFGVFGSMRGRQAEFRKVLDEQKEARKKCSCGCNDFELLTDSGLEWQRHGGTPVQSRPPPENKRVSQLEFACVVQVAFNLVA